MPGTGAFGWLYPGGSFEEGGGGESQKVGTATAAFTASGGDVAEHAENGAGVATFTGSGLRESGATEKTGTAVSGFTASATSNVECAETGSGVLTATGGGGTADAFTKSGTAVLVRAGSGADATTYAQRNKSLTFGGLGWTLGRGHTASGTNEKAISKFGTAVMGHTAQGREGDAVFGTATSGRVASGHKGGSTWHRAGRAETGQFGSGMSARGTSDIEISRSGSTTRGLSGTGAKAITYVEAGTAVSERSASGGSGKAGTAFSPFVGAGTRASIYEESGAAITELSAHGFQHPAGTAIVEFTGGGVLKNLYANDNFVNREIIDVPTGDLEMDYGLRIWQLAGATDRATNETGERRNWVSGTFSNTLWWELTVPFRCVVKFNVVDKVNPVSLRARGQVHDGTAVNALTFYANAAYHYGRDNGKGVDSNVTTQSEWGAFPNPFLSAPQPPIYVQVDPEHPLKLNIGKSSGTFPASAQIEYVATIERLIPPDGDNMSDPIDLDPAGGVLTWDMEGATGDPRWDWESMEEWLYAPMNWRMSGDIFYRYVPPEDQTLRVRISDSNRVQVYFFEGDDFDNLTPMAVNQQAAYPYVLLPDFSGFIDLEVTEGTEYRIAILQMRNVSRFAGFGDTAFFMQYTVRESGTIEWEAVTAPVNDNFADRIDLGSASTGSETTVDTRGSTSEEGEPEDIFQNGALGIWYEFSPTAAGWYGFTLDTIDMAAPFINVFRGSEFADFEYVFSSTYYRPVWLRAGDTYYIRLLAIPLSSDDHVEMEWSLRTPLIAANDDLADAIVLSGASGTNSASTIEGATTELGEPVMYYWNGTQQPSVWYSWTAPADGGCKITFPSFGVPNLGFVNYGEVGVYTGPSIGALTPVVRMSAPVPLPIAFQATAGTEYHIQFGYFPGEFEDDFPGDPYATITIEWEPHVLAANTSFATAIDLPSTTSGGPVVGDNFGAPATVEAGTPDIAAVDEDFFRYGRAVWYRFVSPSSGDYDFNIESGEWDGSMCLFEGETLEALVSAEDDSGNPAFTNTGYGIESITARLSAGTTYYLLIVGVSWPIQADDWIGLQDLTWESDMIPQGDFSLTWTSVNTADNLENARDDLNNLNFFESYFYEGEEWGPINESLLSGRCLVSSNIGATAQVGEPAHVPGLPATRSVWFHIWVAAYGSYRVSVTPAGDNPIQDPVLAVYPYVASMGSLGAPLASNDNFVGSYPQLDVTLQEFTRYLIVVDGRDEGTFELSVRHEPALPRPANDDFADAISVTEELLIAGATGGSTVECGEPMIAGAFAGPYGSVWYRYDPETSGTAFLSGTVSGTDNGWFTYFDVFQGTSLEDLVNITPADSYFNGGFDETVNFPFTFTAGTPIYIRATIEADDTDFNEEGPGSTFSFTLDLGSATPPGNDDDEDAIDSGAGTTPGSTDGSTIEPGEPDPNGGLLEETQPAGSTTWHKYIPDAPGFVDIYTTRDTPVEGWYRVGVYEGETAKTGIRVTAFAQDPNAFNVLSDRDTGAHPCHFEVRQDQTYWIQVVRDGDQSWGEYDLHIDEYLEYNDWKDADGFTSTTGTPQYAGGVLTCTGNQGLADELLFQPQYKTVDLGTDTPDWGREFRTYFEIRVIGGQVLHREVWYGGDQWTFSLASSDEHETTYTRRVGLLRARDTGGTTRLAVSLGPPNNKGENTIYFQTASNTMQAAVSLGAASPVHDSGWVAVELIGTCFNGQRNDGSEDFNSYPLWTFRAYVDGRPVDGSVMYTGEQIRYIDWGMYRHPTLKDQKDQRYVENSEVWTYDMRRMRATNIVPKEPLYKEFHDDLGVFEFDGFANGVPWKDQGGLHVWTETAGFPATVVDFPDKPGWGAMRTQGGAGLNCQKLNYGGQTSSRRMYGFSFQADAWPTVRTEIAGYDQSGSLPGFGTGMGIYTVDENGELRIRPYRTPDFCVAHPALGQHYFVETHVDAEVMWDVRCKVWINGVSFNEYSNGMTYADVAAFATGVTSGNLPASHAVEDDLTFGIFKTQAGGPSWDLYFSNTVAARGSLAESWGPLQTVTVPATTGAVEHHIPDEPEDTMELDTADGGSHSKLYNWMYEDTDPGPLTVAVNADGGGGVYMPIFGPRYWETYFTLDATHAWEESNVGSGNDWSPVNEGRTRVGDGVAVSASAPTKYLRLLAFGQSVPVDAIITGIEVRVGRRGSGGVEDASVSILKNAAFTGTDMNQGDLVFWATDWEIAVYGGPEELWGESWTPQDINSAGFGVAIQAEGSGTAEIDQVSIRVYFADEGGPENIDRGSFLDNSGLFNLYGDFVIAEFDYSGTPTPGISWPSSGWEPGGPSGGSGSHQWRSVHTLWLWQARGDLRPFFLVNGTPGAEGTATNMRIVRNALSYPRFAWSADDGATWEWVYPGESEMENHVGGDVGEPGVGDVIFADNAAAVERWIADKGGWSAGLTEDRPTSTPAYRYKYYYIGFVGGDTDEETIHATNLWARWRGYSGYPKEDPSTTGTFRMYIADIHGGVRRAGTYSGGGTFANPSIGRFTMARDASGEAWEMETFNEIQTRIGYNQATSTSAFSTHQNQGSGAAIYAANWEILVPAEPDPPPPPCEQPKYASKITVKK